MEVLLGMLVMYFIANLIFSGLAFRFASPSKWAWWEFSIFPLPFMSWLAVLINIEIGGKSLSNAFIEPAIIALFIASFIWTRDLLGNNPYGKTAIAVGTVVAMGAGAAIYFAIPGLRE